MDVTYYGIINVLITMADGNQYLFTITSGTDGRWFQASFDLAFNFNGSITIQAEVVGFTQSIVIDDIEILAGICSGIFFASIKTYTTKL